MDSKKDFNINYKPRKKESKFILFSEMQEDYFGVRNEKGITLFGAEIVKECLHPTEYFDKYDVLYYEDFHTMMNDVKWISECMGDRPYSITFHEIDYVDKWFEKVKKFEKNIKNSLMLLSHPEYKYHYDLIWRSF